METAGFGEAEIELLASQRTSTGEPRFDRSFLDWLGGAGHFRVRIASARFVGLAPLARHRLVYDSVRDWMPDRIHALSIDARIPDR